MLDSVIKLRDMAVDAINTAWGFSKQDGTIFLGIQHIPFGASGLPELPLNTASIRLDNVPRDFVAMRQVGEEHHFEIGAKFAIMPNMIVEDLKVLKAQQLEAELTNDANVKAADGMLPLVYDVQFGESLDPNEPAFELLLRWRVKAMSFQ